MKNLTYAQAQEKAKKIGWYIKEEAISEDAIHWYLFSKTGKYAYAHGILKKLKDTPCQYIL